MNPRNCPALCILLAAAVALAAAAATAAEPIARLHNPNAIRALVPFTLRPGAAGRDLPAAVRARDKVLPLDRLPLDEGPVAVGLIDLAPLDTVALEPAPAAPTSPWATVKTQADGLVLSGADGLKVSFAGGRLAEIYIPELKRPYAAAEVPVADGKASVRFAGASVTWIRVASDKAARDYFVYRNGLIEVVAPDYALDCPAGSEWHSYKPTIGLGLVRITGSNVFHFHSDSGQSSWDNYPKSVFPMEWLISYSEAQRAGLWVRAASPQTEVKVDYQKTKRVTFSGKGGPVRVQLAPLGAPQAGKGWYLKSAPVLVTDARGAGKLDAPALEYAVEDLDGDGPDMDADRWTFRAGGKISQAWQFGKGPDGITCSILSDADGNGRLDGLELAAPGMTLVDWNGDGRFFFGPVLYGGFLVSDRFVMRAGDPLPSMGGEAYDLNGDDIVDISRIGGAIFMNFDSRDIGSLITVMPWGGAAGNREAAIGDATWFLYTHGSCARFGCGGLWRGGIVSYSENHYSINLQEDTSKPEVKFRTVSGANFIDARPTPSYIVSRVTIGNLDGKRGDRTYDWNLKFSSEREGQQPHDLGEGMHKEQWNIYKDPWGHAVRIRSPLFPKDWKGEHLSVRPQASLGGLPDLMPEGPWTMLVTNRYKRAYCLFEPQGVEGERANEGIHSWIAPYMISRRWEPSHEPNQGTFTLYFSPLFNGVHFKGADWGSQNGDVELWGKTTDRLSKDGIKLITATGRAGSNFGDNHRHRRWGDRFLDYRDRDGDGYFDVYLWDKENDGTYDSGLWYDAKSGVVEFRHNGFLAAWPYRAEFVDCPVTLDRYGDLQKLWQKNFRQGPAAARWMIGPDGAPKAEPQPQVYVSLPETWLPLVAADSGHADRAVDPWADFGDTGLMRFSTVLAERKFRTALLKDAWTADSLAGLDALVIHKLDRMPAEAEWKALSRWIATGGRLLALNGHESPEQACLLNTLLKPLGMAFGFEPLAAETLAWRWPAYADGQGVMRMNWRYDRIDRFSSSDDALLKDMRWLSFSGTAVSGGSAAKTLLVCDRSPLIAQLAVGKGRVLVCGADFFVNRRYMSVDTNDTECDIGNLELVGRLLDRWLEGVSPPAIREVVSANGGWRAAVSGAGGPALLSALKPGQRVKVNGTAVQAAGGGAAAQVQLTGPGPWKMEVQ